MNPSFFLCYRTSQQSKNIYIYFFNKLVLYCNQNKYLIIFTLIYFLSRCNEIYHPLLLEED